MEHMRRVAYETVLRACGFASLAIFCVMIGFSFQPRLAFQTGGTLTMLMTLVLIQGQGPGGRDPQAARQDRAGREDLIGNSDRITGEALRGLAFLLQGNGCRSHPPFVGRINGVAKALEDWQAAAQRSGGGPAARSASVHTHAPRARSRSRGRPGTRVIS